MDNRPAIQHWLVSVARAAGLPGAEDLNASADVPTAAVWDLVALHTGVDEDTLARCVADHYRLGVADLAAADSHAHKLVPGRVARRLQIVPLHYSDRHLTVATADPVSMDAERVISEVSARTVRFEVAPPPALASAVAARYPEEEELRHELPPLPREARGGPRVLVVDDDADVRHLLRTVMEERGFRVEEASDGPEALEKLDGAEPFDLVTLDLAMEEMHGLEVLRRIRSRLRTAALPVVVATGSDDPAVEIELFEAGADDFIVKPVDPPRFILRIQAVLRRRGVSPGQDLGSSLGLPGF